MSRKRKQRAFGLSDILSYNPTVLPFDGEWRESLGCPELTGTWLIWGHSGNGKTRFALQLAKYLCRFCKVVYNSLEEGLSLSLQKAIVDTSFSEVRSRFTLLDKVDIETLKAHLRRQRSAKVVFIDSLQYTGMVYKDYTALKDEFRDKLFVIISHASGRDPRGSVAVTVRYDANVKIYVDKFKAYPTSRYGGGAPYIIWKELFLQEIQERAQLVRTDCAPGAHPLRTVEEIEEY